MNKTPQVDIFGEGSDGEIPVTFEETPTEAPQGDPEGKKEDNPSADNDKGGDNKEQELDRNFVAQRKFFQSKLDEKEQELEALRKQVEAVGGKEAPTKAPEGVDLPVDPQDIATLKQKLEDRREDMTETEIDLMEIQIKRMERENQSAIQQATKTGATGDSRLTPELRKTAEEAALELSGNDYEIAQAVLDGLKELNLSDVKNVSDMKAKVAKAHKLVVSDNQRRFQQDGKGGAPNAPGAGGSSSVDSIIDSVVNQSSGNYEL